MLRKDYFKEHLSEFLKGRIAQLKDEGRFGDAKRLELQYLYSPKEEEEIENYSDRHYHADAPGINLERLYEHHCCMEINFSCAAHCRYCLRSNYDKTFIKDEEIAQNVNYINEQNLSEVLITGGDPFMTPKILRKVLESISVGAPNIKIVRIATRLFTQNPSRITSDIIDLLSFYQKYFRIEVATQINAWVELEPKEVQDAIKKVQRLGITIYSQNVFLKGVNDDPNELVKLYTSMRNLGIEAHYLFHAVPLKGTDHLRTSVMDMVRCYNAAFNSGKVSGRCKPILAVMSDCGKIILNNLNTLEFNGDSVILKSDYKYSDRIKWNPDWKLPKNCWVDCDDNIWIEYLGANSSKSKLESHE